MHYLTEIDEKAELTVVRPSQSYAQLLENKVDAAILSIVDFFDSEKLEIVESLGICAKGPVKSVLLCCRKQVSEIQTVRLDPASKTSNVLARILLEQHFKVPHDIHYDRYFQEPDAEVIIADRALIAKPTGPCYDMAREWYNMTGLGFVFAVWACQKHAPQYDQIASILNKCKQKGQADIPYLAKLYSEKLQLDKDFCEQYLSKRIRYEIGPREEQGMRLFRQFYHQLTVG